MDERRLRELNGRDEARGACGVYWMQAAVRGRKNPALDWAVERAGRKGLPLKAVFCLDRAFPGASPIHYRYLLEGLREAAADLAAKGIGFTLLSGPPELSLGAFAADAAFVAVDCGWLRVQRRRRNALAAALDRRLVEIEAETLLPVPVASPKEEWSAYTLRRRVMPLLDSFLETAQERVPALPSLGMEAPAAARPFVLSLEGVLAAPPGEAPARAAEQVPASVPGLAAADAAFDAFLETRLENYDRDRNDPNLDGSSNMSAALHFGHAWAPDLARRVLEAVGARSALDCPHPGAAAFIEELVVRRELAVNFAAYNPSYDSYACLPDWARRTLAEGALHPREAVYSFDRFEAAATHDPYWNAAQDQMVLTGRMHGYMRMYWGKGLLAWSRGPEEAYAAALALNDRYSLDGRDPNGCAGVAWCFGKHDRPWTGRPVFGTVRYMNANGLKRKFDADRWVRRVRELKEARCSTT